MAHVDFAVRMPVEHLQGVAAQAFQANGLTVNWKTGLEGRAERGSKAANFVGGALAQYYAVDFKIFPAQAGATLRVIKGNTGLMGGVWGAMKVNAKFKEVTNGLQNYFQQTGVLAGMQKG